MHKAPLVKDIMCETRFSVAPDTPVYEAVDLLIAKKVSGLPVLEGNRVIGFLTEKDCLRLQATAHQYNMTGRTARDIMSTINEYLHPGNDLLTVAQVFIQCNFPALPVIDEDDVLLGSVTRLAVAEGIQKWHHDRGLDFQREKAAQQMVDNPTSIEAMQILVNRSSNKEQLASVFRSRS
ncbi:MAG: CBS domain-containing protein [Candidatus Hydrogenedentota bacterium]